MVHMHYFTERSYLFNLSVLASRKPYIKTIKARLSADIISLKLLLDVSIQSIQAGTM